MKPIFTGAWLQAGNAYRKLRACAPGSQPRPDDRARERVTIRAEIRRNACESWRPFRVRRPPRVGAPHRTRRPDSPTDSSPARRRMAFFFAAAIDTSCPTDAAGNRLDQMDRSGHYARWEEDFECARSLGATALRFGPAYYRTHTGPGRFDWESCEAPMTWLKRSRLTLIAE